MRGSLFLIVSCLMLTACDPNKAESEQPNDTKIISVEQQKRAAVVLQELENTLLNDANVELNEAENILTERIELESEQNEQQILDKAQREKASSEQELIESAKMQSAKKEALLNQAADAKKLSQL